MSYALISDSKRLSFPETVTQIKSLAQSREDVPYFYIEDVGYQRSLIEQLKHDGLYNIIEAKTHGQDKRSRLAMTTNLIQSGNILFPRKGAEKLIQQLTGFGIEKHDDLADAFAILVLKTIEENPSMPRIFFV